MKLTREELRIGLDAVLNQDWPAFRGWMEDRRVVIDMDVVESTLRKCMLAGDPEKAIKMFRAAFEDMDPEATRAAGRLVNCGCLLLILMLALGAVGGIVALAQLVF